MMASATCGCSSIDNRINFASSWSAIKDVWDCGEFRLLLLAANQFITLPTQDVPTAALTLFQESIGQFDRSSPPRDCCRRNQNLICTRLGIPCGRSDSHQVETALAAEIGGYLPGALFAGDSAKLRLAQPSK